MNTCIAILRAVSGFALFVVLLGPLFTSCSPILYTATGHNVPLLREKGEVSFGGGYAETDYASGVSLQFATAIDSSVAIGVLFHSLSSFPSGDWGGNGTYIDGMVGKFGSSKNGRVVWEAFAGFGYGSVKNKYQGEHVNASYIKPYVQPSVGVAGKIGEIAFTPRIAVVNYTSQSYNVSDILVRDDVVDFFDKRGTTLVFEPGITARLGYKSVKLQAQYSYTSFSYHKNDWNPVDSEFLSLGITFLISNRYMKK